MKILKVAIRNFKAIKDLDVDLNGKSIYLLGENGVGKSTFIDAIEIALGLKEQSGPSPVRKKSKSASIQVVTGADGREYRFQAIYRTPDSKPIIEVITPDAALESRVGVISSIVGSIDFDIDEFVELSRTEAGKKKQVQIVKELLSTDVQEVILELEQRIASNYEKRTAKGRDLKATEGVISKAGIDDEIIDKYREKIDVTGIEKQYHDALTRNSERKSINERFEARAERITDLERQIKELQDRLKSEHEKQELAAKHLRDNPFIETEHLQAQLNDARTHNEMHVKVHSFMEAIEEKEKLSKQYEKLSKQIEKDREQLNETVRNSNLPIKGLKFDENALYYKAKSGYVEVDERQLSTSEIMHLGVQVKMAKNPNVHILTIRRGESLGAQKVKEIQEMAKKYGYQIIQEEVTRGQEELKIEFMPE